MFLRYFHFRLNSCVYNKKLSLRIEGPSIHNGHRKYQYGGGLQVYVNEASTYLDWNTGCVRVHHVRLIRIFFSFFLGFPSLLLKKGLH